MALHFWTWKTRFAILLMLDYCFSLLISKVWIIQSVKIVFNLLSLSYQHWFYGLHSPTLGTSIMYRWKVRLKGLIQTLALILLLFAEETVIGYYLQTFVYNCTMFKISVAQYQPVKLILNYPKFGMKYIAELQNDDNPLHFYPMEVSFF